MAQLLASPNHNQALSSTIHLPAPFSQNGIDGVGLWNTFIACFELDNMVCHLCGKDYCTYPSTSGV